MMIYVFKNPLDKFVNGQQVYEFLYEIGQFAPKLITQNPEHQQNFDHVFSMTNTDHDKTIVCQQYNVIRKAHPIVNAVYTKNRKDFVQFIKNVGYHLKQNGELSKGQFIPVNNAIMQYDRRPLSRHPVEVNRRKKSKHVGLVRQIIKRRVFVEETKIVCKDGKIGHNNYMRDEDNNLFYCYQEIPCGDKESTITMYGEILDHTSNDSIDQTNIKLC